MKIALSDAEATTRLGQVIAPLLTAGDSLLLYGPLGMGKSTLARGLIRALTTPDEDVPSPTFTLVQSYDLPAGPAHHFDLYRLDGPEGLAELGWEEAREGIVLVEWPERLGNERPAGALTVTLEPLAAEEARRVTLSGWDERLGALAA